MPRRREVPKRIVIPDPRYHDKLVAKCINCLMRDGKRSIAESILYGAFEIIDGRQQGKEDNSLQVFKKAVENVKPAVEVKSRRVGGSTYQVPVEIRPERRQALALRWLITFSRRRPEKTMMQRLANELMDAYHNRGSAVKRREETHRMADANKAFAHYRW